MNKKTGKLIVITGPSGVGKGTIVKELLKKNPAIFLSISATTRPPREGEIDGQNYYFLTKENFEIMIAQSELLEWAEYAGNYYGTPKKPVLDNIEQGKTIILEIEVLGANQVQNNYPYAQRIFILPPSFTELEKRLRGRGTDNEATIIKRLTKAQEEIAVSNEFTYRIINNDLDKAVKEIEDIIC